MNAKEMRLKEALFRVRCMTEREAREDQELAKRVVAVFVKCYPKRSFPVEQLEERVVRVLQDWRDRGKYRGE